MNNWPHTRLLVLALFAGAGMLLHLAIGMARDRLLAGETTSTDAEGKPLPTGRTLFVTWLGYGLRTFVWTSCGLLAVYLLPHTRTRVETVSERVRRLADRAVEWLLDRGLNAAITIIITIFLMRFAAAAIETIFVVMKRRATGRDPIAAQRRLGTLANIFGGAAQSAIFFIGLMTVLQQLNVNVTPILASAGVVGIAIGFGAQSLIRDLFSGFLILLEDQFSVGDIVRIGDFTGSVEQVTLRATRIRAVDGALTTIPNGGISTVSNLTRDWSQVALDIEIDYSEDADRAMQVALAVARGLRAEIPQEIPEDPNMLGIDRIGSGAVVLRLLVRTAPSRQFDIARELRRRVKLAFDNEDIKAPLNRPLTTLWPIQGHKESAPPAAPIPESPAVTRPAPHSTPDPKA